MKVRIFAIIFVILSGAAVFFAVFSDNKKKDDSYSEYIELAVKNAEKDIPYNAVMYYRKAFEIRCADEETYEAYIAQCELLGGDFYYDAINDYLNKFPDSPRAHEALCKYYFDGQDYKRVFEVALDAKERDIATDAVKEMFINSRYKYKYIKGGLTEATPFLGKYAKVKRDDFYGYIEDNGQFLLFPRYEEAGFFAGDSTAVKADGKWMMINELGYKVAVCSSEPDGMSYMSNGIVPIKVGEKYGYTDTSLVIPESLPYDYASNFRSDVAAVKKGEKWAIINSNREYVTEFIFDDVIIDDFNTCINNGIILARQGSKYYLYDATGTKISENGYEYVYPFASEEYAAFKKGDKWGFIDATGQVVIEPQFDEAKSFCVGLAPVKVGELWGYINTDGKVCIDCVFEDCIPFSSNGVTAVKEQTGWSYIKLLLYTS